MYAVLTLLCAGCVTHLKGLVQASGAGPELMAPDGQVYKLALPGPAAPVAFLEGHLIEVSGPRLFKAVRVDQWTVGEGLHGLSTWVGELRWMGDQIGIDDRNSGGFYWVDDATARLLGDVVGRPVLLEGYVDGPHRVKVQYYRVLDDVD